jgi:HEPN domain-containing protein
MEIDEKVKYWIDISDYDLVTAEAMLETKRLLYVGFMCHQAVEKILKGYYTKINSDTPPYIHNLLVLAERTSLLKELSEEQSNLLSQLNPLNIKARYPQYKEMILKELSNEDCLKLIKKTREFIEWVKMRLSK